MTTIQRGMTLAVLLLTAACGSAAPVAKSPGPCSTDIRVIPGEVEGAAGHRFLTLAFNNVGKRPCLISGYPSVDLVDSSGHVVVHARHTLRGQAGLPAGVTRPPTVMLQPGKSASAAVEASAIPEGDAPQCADHSLMVTPPGQSRAVPAGRVTMPDCDVQVHPVTTVR